MRLIDDTMDNELKNVLKSALSLLSEQQAEEAMSEVLRHYRGREAREDLRIVWADFALDGHFLRGGISDIVFQETHITTNSQEFADVHEIVQLQDREFLSAGSFQWDAKHKRLVWVLPLTTSKREQVPDTRLRCLSITEAVFGNVVRTFNAEANLSPSEERVILQVVAGIDLRTAAADDGVSYETKRMHLKNASQKLACSGQKEIVRKILGQMVHILTLSDAETANIDIAEAFVSRYLADDTRLSVQRLGNGRLLRILECGPSDGTPVIMIHGMMFPITLYGLSRHLHEARIRLIIPIRSGFLDPLPASELVSSEQLIVKSLEDIAVYIQKNGLRPVTLLGQSLGAVLAERFAETYPALVSRLILVSTNLARTRQTQNQQAGEFYGAMRELASDPEIFSIINKQFSQYYARKSTCKEILLRLFGPSSADINVLDGHYSGVSSYEMFAKLYQDSTCGMTADFVFTMRLRKSASNRLTMPVTIIHGSRDSLTELEELGDIEARADDCTLLTIDDGGHFVSVSHARQVWGSIGEVVRH